MRFLLLSLCALLWSVAAFAQKPKPGTKTNPTTKPKDEPKAHISDTAKVVIRREKTAADSALDSIYQARIRMAKIDNIYIPKDLNDCFRELDKAMDADAKEEFMAFADAEVDRKTHGTLGKWIEKRWSMREGSRISHYFHEMGVPHPDYAVGIIITSYHRHLNKREIKLKEQVEFFRNIWQEKQRKEANRMLEEAEKEKDKSKPK